jgi:TRAP-type C4-dicarboxylate transport system substrate-binding protein
MTLSRRKLLLATSANLFLPAIWTRGALAQPAVTLKLHHFVSAQSNQQKYWFEPWGKKIEQGSGGRIKVEIYPSMQLGGKQPQLYDQVKDGVVDIVWTVAGTTPGRFPKLEVFELPFLSHSVGERTAPAVWDFYEKFAKDELKEVKPLAVWSFGQGALFVKDKVIKRPEDAKGLKLRASNRQTNDVFALIGANPQSIPPPGVPEALAKGVVDGVIFPYDAVIAFKLDELTNRVTEFAGDRTLYASVLIFAMNKAKYESLPDDLKKVIDTNSGPTLARDLGKKWDEWDQIGRAAILKRGTPITRVDGDDLVAWKTATEPVIAKWIDERTRAGDKGADLVKAARDLIGKYSA